MQLVTKADLLPFDASGWSIGIALAQFNLDITSKLLDSAVARASAYKISTGNINIVKVAGSIELPLALQHMAESKKYQALLAIGCVIRGDTPHFDYVCKFATDGILRVQLDYKQAIGFGILTCENKQQALERANLGGEHLDATLHLAKVLQPLAFDKA